MVSCKIAGPPTSHTFAFLTTYSIGVEIGSSGDFGVREQILVPISRYGRHELRPVLPEEGLGVRPNRRNAQEERFASSNGVTQELDRPVCNQIRGVLPCMKLERTIVERH